jgi:hypothetical protein
MPGDRKDRVNWHFFKLVLNRLGLFRVLGVTGAPTKVQSIKSFIDRELTAA